VDHRTLAAQGFDRAPQIHLRPSVMRMENRGLRTERGDQAMHIARTNVQLEQRRAELARIEAEAARERDAAGGDLSRDSSPPTDAGSPNLEVEAERDAVPRDRDPESEHENADRNRSPLETEPGPERDDRQLAAGSPRRGTAPPTRDHESEARQGPNRSHENHTRVRPDPEPSTARRIESAESDAGRSRGEAFARGEPSRTEPVDRTARAVAGQLAAMGCERYEIGILEAPSGRMMNRSGTAEEILAGLPWLKHMNAAGNDIFVRPARDSSGPGLVLVDDLGQVGVSALRRDGRGPALVVETSPGNFQAWVRVPGSASSAERGEIARRLAREYDADPGSTSPHQFGRLAGFTNRKSLYRDADGLHPFALLRETNGARRRAGVRCFEMRTGRAGVRPVTQRKARRPSHLVRTHPHVRQNARRSICSAGTWASSDRASRTSAAATSMRRPGWLRRATSRRRSGVRYAWPVRT
jgi:hypothetical protein